MYPRNAASPERIAIGAVVQISDGAVQTSGVVITVRGQGGAEGTGGGTTVYGASGIVYYTPIQAETNFTSFVVIGSKTGCIPVAQTIVTTATATPGAVVISGTTQTLDALQTAQNSAHGAGSWATATGFATPTNITAGTITTATNLTNLPSIPADWITAAGITAAALNGKGDWSTVAPDNTSITAIKIQTDKLAFTVANQVDANIKSVNDLAVDGSGTTGDPWGPV